MILIHGDNSEFTDLPPEAAKQMIEALEPFESTVKSEGKLLANQRLVMPEDAKLYRIRSGKTAITDGPFSETKEQFGGYYLVEAESMDQVLGWLKLIPPMMDSTIEVRQAIQEERSLP